ncbi:MAG: sigma-70 family RNA polymerase sigma factor [Gemmatimonadetes bacterium]|nr:sigma-70 family RNA polymerase sigma factor [Gemmatimonadota bacterium]
MTPPRGEVTGLLAELRSGNKEALAKLIPLVYDELHRLAEHYMRNERVGHTLQPTALINEAYLRLASAEKANWQHRAHFVAVAAGTMRRVLIDHARKQKAAKRGGKQAALPLEDSPEFLSEERSEELIALDEALTRLQELDPRQSQVVELRFFGGLTVEETAEVLGISPKTVKRDWAVARAWLHGEMSKDHSE